MSYSRYWTGTSLQWRLMWGNIIKKRLMSYSRYWTGTNLKWRLMWGNTLASPHWPHFQASPSPIPGIWIWSVKKKASEHLYAAVFPWISVPVNNSPPQHNQRSYFVLAAVVHLCGPRGKQKVRGPWFVDWLIWLIGKIIFHLSFLLTANVVYFIVKSIHGSLN